MRSPSPRARHAAVICSMASDFSRHSVQISLVNTVLQRTFLTSTATNDLIVDGCHKANRLR